jgi:phosphoglycerate-specific signal transduction histidine kinase
MSAGPKGDDKRGLEASLLEELRQPLAAASNYLGAARMLIAPVDHDSCVKALERLTQAEQQLIRAGGIIGKIRDQNASRA